jgi:hypothetical protein
LRNVSVAPSAISGGGVSPIGEPLAMLPPMVPMLRTCSPPMRSTSAPKRRDFCAEQSQARLRVGDAGADRELPC